MLVLSTPSHIPATLLVASYQLPYLISQLSQPIITLWKDRLPEFCILNHQGQVTRRQGDPGPGRVLVSERAQTGRGTAQGWWDIVLGQNGLGKK